MVDLLYNILVKYLEKIIIKLEQKDGKKYYVIAQIYKSRYSRYLYLKIPQNHSIL